MNSREAIEVVAKEVNMPDLWERIKNMGRVRTDYVDSMGIESKEVNEEKGYVADKMQEVVNEVDEVEDEQAGVVRRLSEAVAQIVDMELRRQLEENISELQSVMIGSEEDEDKMKVEEEKMILSEPRTPNYEGTEDVSWGDVDKTLANYVAGYVRFNPDAEQPEGNLEEVWATVDSLPQPVRDWIAAKSFLGNADAETFEDMLFFPGVNPNTNNLNRGALMAVVSGRGSQADIPQSLYEQVTEVAYELLESEFDYMSDEEKMEEEVAEVEVEKEAEKEKEIDVDEIAEALQLKELGVLLENHERVLAENDAKFVDVAEAVKENAEGLKAVDKLLEAIEELVEKQKEMFGRLEELEHKSVELEKADEEKIAEKQNRFTPFWASRYQASKAAESVLSDEDAKQYNKPEVPSIIQDMTKKHIGGGK